jgi:predicted PurR-regulated permease PerM
MAVGEFTRVERSIIIIALLFIILLAVKMTSYIISLFLMALVMTMLATPSLLWLRKRGLSDFVATLVVSLCAVLVALGFIGLTALSFQAVISAMPQYQQDLTVRLTDITNMLAPYGLSAIVSKPPELNLGQLFSIGVGSAMSLADGLMFIFFVGVLTFFMLLEVPRITAHLEEHFGKDSHTMHHFSRMVGYVIDFIVVRTETNFIYGVLFGGFLGLIGVHGAILWGTLLFLLGFIPYFGLFIAAIPAIFFAWLQYGIPGAVAVIVVILVLNLVIENPVLSWLTARKFEMPALMVIVSVIFWGWLLGLVGMLFAVPFTLMILLTFQLSDELRYINVALGVDHLFQGHDITEIED